MSWLYFLKKERDCEGTKPAFSGFFCYKVQEMRYTKRNGRSFMVCKYYVEQRLRHKSTNSQEGNPYGESYAFYLHERDDERALEIMKRVLHERNDVRKENLKIAASKYLREQKFINLISLDILEGDVLV